MINKLQRTAKPRLHSTLNEEWASRAMHKRYNSVTNNLVNGLGAAIRNPKIFEKESATAADRQMSRIQWEEQKHVRQLDDWFTNKVSLVKHEFEMNHEQGLQKIMMQTRNYRNEKNFEDIEKFNQVFRHWSKSKEAKKSESHLQPLMDLHSTALENQLAVNAEEDPGKNPKYSGIRQELLKETIINKAFRLVSKSTPNLHRKASSSLGNTKVKKAVITDDLEAAIDKVCNVHMLEALVASFKTISQLFSFDQLHRKAAEGASLLKEHLEERSIIENVNVHESIFDDIERYEISLQELETLSQQLESSVAECELKIVRLNDKLEAINNSLHLVEKTRMFDTQNQTSTKTTSTNSLKQLSDKDLPSSVSIRKRKQPTPVDAPNIAVHRSRIRRRIA